MSWEQQEHAHGPDGLHSSVDALEEHGAAVRDDRRLAQAADQLDACEAAQHQAQRAPPRRSHVREGGVRRCELGPQERVLVVGQEAERQQHARDEGLRDAQLVHHPQLLFVFAQGLLDNLRIGPASRSIDLT